MAIILKVLILKKLKKYKPMYTQECFLRKPGIHDVRMLNGLGYKSIDKSNKKYQVNYP